MTLITFLAIAAGAAFMQGIIKNDEGIVIGGICGILFLGISLYIDISNSNGPQHINFYKQCVEKNSGQFNIDKNVCILDKNTYNFSELKFRNKCKDNKGIVSNDKKYCIIGDKLKTEEEL